jgi:hypothetical protein
MTLCVQNKQLWEAIPREISGPIDDYLESGWKVSETTGDWWRIRDAKKRVLKTHRDPVTKLPRLDYLSYNIRCMVNVATRLKLVVPKFVTVERSGETYQVKVA